MGNLKQKPLQQLYIKEKLSSALPSFSLANKNDLVLLKH
jgi:hypothetical protein